MINPFAPKHKRFTEETVATLAAWEEADDAQVVNAVLGADIDAVCAGVVSLLLSTAIAAGA